MLTVNCLGKFIISNEKDVLTEDKVRSLMLGKLLAYVILNRDKTISQEDIATVLWVDEEVDNPIGAIRNLMYRLRKELKNIFGDEQFIISNMGGTYKWNPEIETVVDAEEFERLLKEADFEGNVDISIVKYERALSMYEGDFMTKYADVHWIIALSSYYRSLYENAIKSLCEKYLKRGLYREIDQLCSEAIVGNYADEMVYCYRIQALIRLGNVQSAIEQYEKARSIMEKELGIRKTAMLNKVYEELLAMNKSEVAYDIEDVKEDMQENEPEGVFLCSYPIFKEIYHLEVRKSCRVDTPQQLLLMTLDAESIDGGLGELSRKRMTRAMDALESMIKRCLRVGDVAAKYSDCQYIILLPTCTDKLARIVANRIISRFYENNPIYKTIKVKIDVEPVSTDGRFVYDKE